MKKLLLLLLSITIISCEGMKDKEYSSSKIELRQLVNKEHTSQNTSGSYFLIMGSVNSSTEHTDIVKMFGKVNNEYYQLIQADLEDVRVIIDNKVKTPYIILKYKSTQKLTDDYILRNSEWWSGKYYIYCSEQYLPERLLPINL